MSIEAYERIELTITEFDAEDEITTSAPQPSFTKHRYAPQEYERII